MYKFVVLIMALFTSQSLLLMADTPAEQWDKWIGIETKSSYPEELICTTEKVFQCGFDTQKCNDGVSDYPKNYSSQKIKINFKKKTVDFDINNNTESSDELHFIGTTTYFSKLKKYPEQAGYILTFSNLGQEIVLVWEHPYVIRPAVQAHFGYCQITKN